MKKIILLDNGHGLETPGKRSPEWEDGTQLFEWEFNRDMTKRISEKCEKIGIRCARIVPESFDVSLSERCARANRWHKRVPDCVLLSIHANAAGGDAVGKATGFEVYTSPGETKADALASALIEQLEADFPDLKMRKDMADGDADKEANFYILKHTTCPALLAENLFMDTESDCRLLMSDEFRDKLAESYVTFIKNI